MPAAQMGATKQFYGAVFGWKFEDYGPDYASFHDGRLAGGLARGELKSVLPVIYASNLAAAVEKVKAAGGVIVKEIFSFPGGRRFHFTDPSGNELAVWSDVGE